MIPNLLHYAGSVVVTDPKGENYAVTARRRRELGSTVHALDPFGVVGGTATFNPFDLVDAKSPDANDDAWLLADMLVVPDGKMREEAFWHEEARALLAGLILYVASHAPPELRTLPHVRSLLTLAPEPFGLLLDDMLESDQVDRPSDQSIFSNLPITGSPVLMMFSSSTRAHCACSSPKKSASVFPTRSAAESACRSALERLTAMNLLSQSLK